MSDTIPTEADSAASEGAGSGALSDQNQFVMFHIGEEMFALSLTEVQEIVRMPDLVRVPLSPPALEGLANLRGTVLPVLGLRAAFGFPARAPDDATRVVVLDRGQRIGVVVDRMANVATVESERIEPVAAIRATIDTALLAGMIKGEDGRSMVMILDAAHLVEHAFAGATLAGGPAAREAGSGPATAEEGRAAGAGDETQLVSFEVAGQEYAFPIEAVEEIVQLPEAVTEVPNVPAHVLGVITLRNRLLPLVSLREIFGLPAAALSDANKVVVIALGADRRVSVGVVMDSVSEVLRVARALIEPVPPLLAGGTGTGDIQAICRIDDGRRLVSILSAEALFDNAEIGSIAKAGGEDMRETTSETGRAAEMAGDEEQFVIFRLMEEEYGVSIDAVQEIVRVPEELTRIPKAPSFIEGVINLRGVVLPVIDQRRRFDLAGIARNDRQRIMVFTIHGTRTGFVVDSVSEVMRIPPPPSARRRAWPARTILSSAASPIWRRRSA
ncbi:chemotaxis protein CheW [Aureimonas endophytica]|uniref:Chemotaxis protein CheW n=1 Tax=Aureimonas endophytica TaxID=2027858 RepID=A0A917E881_9HYPH|nr:chemotaxis protein CheW [Aureimonas endophytica]GGE12920.1 chemotaxis protein CheW [Aureimonas endophytica]